MIFVFIKTSSTARPFLFLLRVRSIEGGRGACDMAMAMAMAIVMGALCGFGRGGLDRFVGNGRDLFLLFFYKRETPGGGKGLRGHCFANHEYTCLGGNWGDEIGRGPPCQFLRGSRNFYIPSSVRFYILEMEGVRTSTVCLFHFDKCPL